MDPAPPHSTTKYAPAHLDSPQDTQPREMNLITHLHISTPTFRPSNGSLYVVERNLEAASNPPNTQPSSSPTFPPSRPSSKIPIKPHKPGSSTTSFDRSIPVQVNCPISTFKTIHNRRRRTRQYHHLLVHNAADVSYHKEVSAESHVVGRSGKKRGQIHRY